MKRALRSLPQRRLWDTGSGGETKLEERLYRTGEVEASKIDSDYMLHLRVTYNSIPSHWLLVHLCQLDSLHGDESLGMHNMPRLKPAKRMLADACLESHE